jgi:hypothetical protein
MLFSYSGKVGKSSDVALGRPVEVCELSELSELSAGVTP